MSASLNSRFQPLQELNHSNTIFKHRTTVALYFCFIFHSLHSRNRRSCSNNFLAFYSFPQIIARFISI
ncbi:Uncharacterised protein [Segatella copri]|nr:Uncharacterised protein [Segatella copri]